MRFRWTGEEAQSHTTKSQVVDRRGEKRVREENVEPWKIARALEGFLLSGLKFGGKKKDKRTRASMSSQHEKTR